MQLIKQPKPQISEPPKFEIVLTDESIHRAFGEAVKAGHDYATKALICGQLLNDKKEEVGHGNWGRWLEANFQGRHRDTLCRWMAAAARVTKALGITDGQWQVGEGIIIDVEAQPLSAILALPEAELEEPAQKARQLFFAFVSDKTIADCLRDVADGTSPDHRIARATNGKLKGGHKGEDRKAWDEFIKKRLSQVNEHISHWDSFSAKQIEEVNIAFEKAVKNWPESFLQTLAGQIKEELKTR